MLTPVKSPKKKFPWENNLKSLTVEEMEKEIMAMLLPLQAKEQNEILIGIATELQRIRKESIIRRDRELAYLKKHATVSRPFWKRLLSK